MTPLSANREIPAIKQGDYWFLNDRWRKAWRKNLIRYGGFGANIDSKFQVNKSTIRLISSGSLKYPDLLDGHNVYTRLSGLHILAPQDIDDYLDQSLRREDVAEYFEPFGIALERSPNRDSQIRITNTHDEGWIEVDHMGQRDPDLLSDGLRTIIAALMIMPSDIEAFEHIEENGLLIYGQQNKIEPVVALPGYEFIDRLTGATEQDFRNMNVETDTVIHEVSWARWASVLIPQLISGDWNPVVVESVKSRSKLS